jgi:alkanesulfonate monooxygenase SsuD/methylene tetrahydromethanopterin reductase-like flavin-dependent oxidoreductase (luciferase family)
MALMLVFNNEAGSFRSQPRSSANRKIDVVLRLLRGESKRHRRDPSRDHPTWPPPHPERTIPLIQAT